MLIQFINGENKINKTLKTMTKQEILNTITSNSMREITEERCYQAMNEFAIQSLNEVIKEYKENNLNVLTDKTLRFTTIDNVILNKIKQLKNGKETNK